MLTDTSRWSHARGNEVVPSRWQATERVHNPRNRECGCDPDCWCRRTALGRAVKWWLPSRPFGPHHKASGSAEWKRRQDPNA